MKQGRLTWPAFAAAVAVVIAAMAWITCAVVRLDAAEAESRRRAQLEENVRLALWRMDSALAPLIAAEHARPAAAFEPLDEYLGQVQSQRALSPRPGGLAPPVLEGTEAQFVRAYFQFDALGLTSPQADASERLAELERLLPRPVLLAALPPPPREGLLAAPQQRPVSPDAVASANGPPSKGFGKGQAARNAMELGARGNSLQQQIRVQTANAAHAQVEDDGPPVGVAMQPVWHAQHLLLARRVMLGGEEVVQGAWVDWPATRQWLLASSADLLNGADLVPHPPDVADPYARRLASLPVRLVPGQLPAGAAGAVNSASPLKVSLVVAWGCVLVATAAVGLLLAGVVSLSERRGAFVSAVTHELRTPLTTLRMYTEMLCDGMVAEEDRRRTYLSTLRAEADRLGHLVENVLAYSRLERNRAGYQPVVIKLGDVLGRVTDRLAERARQAGMELVADVPPGVAERAVRTNPLALEQILFNLVDNACKYAGRAADKRVMVSGKVEPSGVALRVEDRGPGIPPAQAARLFRPFSKSSQEAADTAPGLGLGLALSRRMARSMGGDLRYDGPAAGAAFTLTLPNA